MLNESKLSRLRTSQLSKGKAKGKFFSKLDPQAEFCKGKPEKGKFGKGKLGKGKLSKDKFGKGKLGRWDSDVSEDDIEPEKGKFGKGKLGKGKLSKDKFGKGKFGRWDSDVSEDDIEPEKGKFGKGKLGKGKLSKDKFGKGKFGGWDSDVSEDDIDDFINRFNQEFCVTKGKGLGEGESVQSLKKGKPGPGKKGIKGKPTLQGKPGDRQSPEEIKAILDEFCTWEDVLMVVDRDGTPLRYADEQVAKWEEEDRMALEKGKFGKGFKGKGKGKGKLVKGKSILALSWTVLVFLPSEQNGCFEQLDLRQPELGGLRERFRLRGEQRCLRGPGIWAQCRVE